MRGSNLALVQSHALGGFGALDFESLGLDFLDKAVGAIRVDTTFGPPIYIPNPFRKEAEAAAAGGAQPVNQGFDVARMLKPKITFEMRKGWGGNRAFAPYGDPGPSKWGFVITGVFLTLALAAYGGVNLTRSRIGR